MKTTERSKFIHKYPIVSFFLLALILGTSLISLVFVGIIPGEFALSSALSATIAGIVITAVVDGKPGLKLLFSRLFIWRIGIGYWLFAFLFIVPAVLLGSLFNPLFNGDLVSLSDLRLSLDIIPLYLIFFIAAGLGQDLGWTGFLLPRLQTRFSAFVSSLIRGALIIVWHLPLLIFLRLNPLAIPDFPYGDWIIQNGYLVTLFAMVMFSLPWSIFFTWLFNNTKGSLLLVAAFHGSEVWLAYLLGTRSKYLNNLWGYGLVMSITAAIIIITTGPQNFSRKFRRIDHLIS